MNKNIVIDQARSVKVELQGDKKNAILGNLNQITEFVGRDKSVISNLHQKYL